MDNVPHRRHKGSIWMFWKRRRHLLTFLAFLGFFNMNILRSNFAYAMPFMISTHNVTLGNGTVVEIEDVSWHHLEISKVMSASFYGYVATQILGGWLGACLGGSRVYGVGVAFTALLSLLTPLVTTKTGVSFVKTTRFIQGLFEGVTYPSIYAVWSRWVPPQERARHVSIVFSGSFFSSAAAPVCHFIANTLDWPYIFYLTGIMGLIWCAVWWTVVKDKPEDDPHISSEELKFLKEYHDGGPNDTIPKHIVYPWDKFVTSMPVWAIVMAHICMGWGFSILIIWLPSFMTEMYYYQMETTGFMYLLPQLVMGVMLLVAGTLADWLRNSGVLTNTQVLKVFICGSFISQGILFVLAGDIHSATGTLSCLVMASGLGAFAWTAFSVNNLDIAPQYASALMGLANTISCVVDFQNPNLVLYIIEHRSLGHWQYVFYITMAVYLVGALFYWTFASGKRQRWAPPAVNPDSETLTHLQQSRVV